MSTVVIVSEGLGLLTPALSQGQPQGDPCPQAGCPDKPKDDPPTGQQWILVIVHVGAGVPTCDPDNTPVEGAKISFIGKDNKPILIGSQQPANQSTDAKGRYAAYLALSGPIVEEIKEVKVEKAGFKPSLVTTSVVMRPLASAYLFVRVCLAATNPGLNLTIAAGPGEQAPNLPEAKDEDSWTCVNLDNDNHDGKFDLGQNNVVGENDLVRLTINPPTGGTPNDQVELKVNVKSGDIKLWEDPTKTKQVTLPVKYQAKDLPKTLWIEGVVPSKAARGVELELIPVPPFKATSDKVTLTVIGVEEMTWIGQSNSVNGTDKLDANAHPGPDGTVGKRVFPDAPGPNKSALDKVTLRVTLSAPVPAEFKLYLRALDVDDPSSNSAELDPNDTAAKDGTYPNTTITYTLHEDNRGNVGDLVKSGQFVAVAGLGVEVPKAALTDNQGVQYLPATLTFAPNRKIMDVTFTVTKQPGDNFRVLASCDPEFLKDAVNLDKDHKLDIYNAPAKQAVSWQSEVLTVWRRLHLEVDSMAAPGNANSINGLITNVAAGAIANTSVVTTNQNLADQDQYQCPQGRFPNPCSLRVGAQAFNVLGNSSGPNATVTVVGAPPNNQPFTLHDDDQDNVLPQPVAAPGAVGANTWLAWLQDSDLREENLFADAYVRPVLDGGGKATNNQANLALDLNIENSELTASIVAGKQTTGNADFWISYLQAQFQGPLQRDNDPDDEVDPTTGLPARLGITPNFGDASLIYIESYRDSCGGTDAAAGKRLGIREVVVHEVGHQFTGQHTDGGIMGPYLSGTCLPSQNSFTDVTLNRIRSTRQPGGGTF
jgi:hypothetical protein